MAKKTGDVEALLSGDIVTPTSPITTPEAVADVGLEIQDEKLKQLLHAPVEGELAEVDAAERVKELPEVQNSIRVAANAQVHMAGMHKALSELIDSVGENKSMISRLSHSWGDLGLFGQIGTGAGLTVPFVIAGLAASTPVLVAVGLGGATVYAGMGALLQDHHTHESSNLDRVKTAVLSIVELFTLTINSLVGIAEELGAQVNRLHGENEIYAQNNDALRTKIDTLSDQVVTLTAEVGRMSTENDAFEVSNGKLQTLVGELNVAKAALEKQTKVAVAAKEVLAESVSKLSETALDNEEEHAAFLVKLKAFVKGDKETYERLFDKALKAEKQRDAALHRIEELTRAYEALNQRNAATTDKLERIVYRAEKVVDKSVPQTTPVAPALVKFGLLPSTCSDTKAEPLLPCNAIPAAL